MPIAVGGSVDGFLLLVHVRSESLDAGERARAAGRAGKEVRVE